MSEQRAAYETETAEANIILEILRRGDDRARGNIVRSFSGMMLWLRYDEESGGIIATDQGGSVIRSTDFAEIKEGLNKFFAHYSDSDIDTFNAGVDAERERRASQQREDMSQTEPSKKTLGYIYLIKAENGLFKIGKAKDISKRIKPFSVNFPMKWDLIHSFKSNNYTTAEEFLHERFADKRDIGEWFKLQLEDVEYLMSLQDGSL